MAPPLRQPVGPQLAVYALALIHRLGSHLRVGVGPHDLKSVAGAENIRGHEHRITRLEGTAAGQASRIEIAGLKTPRMLPLPLEGLPDKLRPV